MRTRMTVTAACLAALLIVPVASAARQYLPMKKAALVAKTYQHYLNNHGFKQRCWALGTYLASARVCSETR